MISEIEQPQQHPALAVAAAVTREREACTLPPPGWECPKYAGHPGPCAAAQVNTEPPAADSPVESAPAASSAAPRSYGFKRRPQFDVTLPSGAFVHLRQLTFPQAIELGVLQMRNTFALELLKDLNGDDPELVQSAVDEIEEALVDEERRQNLFGPLNRIAVAALVCPRAVLEGDPASLGADEIHVDEIEFADKMAIFEAAAPDEMKAAAVEERHDALKSLGTEPEDGVRGVRDGDDVRAETE